MRMKTMITFLVFFMLLTLPAWGFESNEVSEETAWEDVPDGWSSGEASWDTGGHASFDGESLDPGESEVEGTAGLYNEDGETSVEGSDNWSEVGVTSSQEAGAEVSARGEETSGKIQGAAQQENRFNTYRANEWDNAQAESFASGGQYGEAGFFGEGESEGDTHLSGSGSISGESGGYIENSIIDEDGKSGYRSENLSFAENSGKGEVNFDGDSAEDGYAYTDGEGVANGGSFVGADFDGVSAEASTYGEAEFDYYTEGSFGSGGVGSSSKGEGKAQTEGYSEVREDGEGGVYAEAWQKSTSSTGSGTESSSTGSVGGKTGSGSSEADE